MNGAVSADGRQAFTVGDGQGIEEGREGDGGRGVTVSPDGKRVLSPRNNVLVMWDTETGKGLHRLEGHTAGIFAHYGGGTIDLRETPPALCALFEEFEEIVNGQMFAFLDDIQGRMGSLPLKAVFDTGEEVSVRDLQVFPSTGDVSFRAAEGPTTIRKPE